MPSLKYFVFSSTTKELLAVDGGGEGWRGEPSFVDFIKDFFSHLLKL